MTRATVRLLTLLLPFGIAACSTTEYPSLAVRDVETLGQRASGSGMPASGDQAPPPPALPPASADLVTRLKGLVATAQEADRQFQSNRTAAERAVAAAGNVGSDSWSNASVALARLETSRSSGMAALAELDVMFADARDAAPAQDPPQVTAIGDARTQVAALLDAQDQVLAALSTRLKG